MKKIRNYQVDYSRYSFKAEDDWGDYDNGKYRTGYFNKNGYCKHSYFCTDGKFHSMYEHIAKWEYFNGRIPEGLEIDHIIPIKNGGTNNLSNIRIGTHKFNGNNELTLINLSESHKGIIPTEETRMKMSESRKGEKNGFYGKHHTKDVLEIFSKKIYQYSLDGELIAIWPCVADAVRSGFNHAGDVARGQRNQCRGYKWSYTPL